MVKAWSNRTKMALCLFGMLMYSIVFMNFMKESLLFLIDGIRSPLHNFIVALVYSPAIVLGGFALVFFLKNHEKL